MLCVMEDCGYVCVIKLALRQSEVRTELHVEKCADLVITNARSVFMS